MADPHNVTAGLFRWIVISPPQTYGASASPKLVF